MWHREQWRLALDALEAGGWRLTRRPVVADACYGDVTEFRLDFGRRARQCWPQITELRMRHHGVFTCVEATTIDTTMPLCRLRYSGPIERAMTYQANALI